MTGQSLTPENASVPTFLRRKIIQPILNLLKQGVTPKKLALGIAFGITIGICPVLGTTTLLCALIAFTFRINQPAIQLVNYVVYPLQILLVLPFIKMGAFIFNNKQISYSISDMGAMFRFDIFNAIHVLGQSILQAAVAWAFTAPILGVATYYLMLAVLKNLPMNKNVE